MTPARAAADTAGIRQRRGASLSGGVLVNGQQARAAALLEHLARGGPWSLGRDHRSRPRSFGGTMQLKRMLKPCANISHLARGEASA
jgi:hypothetical protein